MEFSTMAALHVLLDSLGAFLGPYIPDIIVVSCAFLFSALQSFASQTYISCDSNCRNRLVWTAASPPRPLATPRRPELRLQTRQVSLAVTASDRVLVSIKSKTTVDPEPRAVPCGFCGLPKAGPPACGACRRRACADLVDPVCGYTVWFLSCMKSC